MRNFFFLIFFILSLLKVDAQTNKYIDSVKIVLLHSADDTTKVRNTMYLADKYVWAKPDSALFYARESLKLAEKLNDTLGQVFNLGTLSYIYSMRRNDSLALETIFHSIRLSESKNVRFRTFSWYDIVIVYFNLGDYQKAIEFAYKYKNEFPSSVNVNKTAHLLLGKTFYRLNQIDSALNHLLAFSNTDESAEGLVYLGHIFRIKGEFQKSQEHLRKGIDLSFGKEYNLMNVIEGYLGLSKTLLATNQLDSATWYIKKAFEMATVNSFPAQKLDASILLKDIYDESGNIDSAFKYQSLTLSLKDSLFNQEKIRAGQNINFQESRREAAMHAEMDAAKKEYKNRIKSYLFIGGLLVFFVAILLLWKNGRQKQKANETLKLQKTEIESTLDRLQSAQSQLIQSEKMASLGELTAGIAHEIQNPLNFVNNFSEVNTELIDELNEQLTIGNTQLAKEISDNLKQNEKKINHHGKRAEAIVKNMLQHSRSSSGQKELTDINALADEYLRLSYHGLRAKDKEFNASYVTDFDSRIGKISIVPQDLGRVLLNLINNAFYAVAAKASTSPNGFIPSITVTTKKLTDKIEISVTDNGNGIPETIRDKIFQPFFTTKPTGQGTGLGLSLSYDIITKGHGGELKLATKEGEGSTFTVIIPANSNS